MTILSISFGPNDIYAIKVSLFDMDKEFDMAIWPWDIIAAKFSIKCFSMQLVILSLTITDTRVSVCILNCYLSLFWGVHREIPW